MHSWSFLRPYVHLILVNLVIPIFSKLVWQWHLEYLVWPLNISTAHTDDQFQEGVLFVYLVVSLATCVMAGLHIMFYTRTSFGFIHYCLVIPTCHAIWDVYLFVFCYTDKYIYIYTWNTHLILKGRSKVEGARPIYWFPMYSLLIDFMGVAPIYFSIFTMVCLHKYRKNIWQLNNHSIYPFLSSFCLTNQLFQVPSLFAEWPWLDFHISFSRFSLEDSINFASPIRSCFFFPVFLVSPKCWTCHLLKQGNLFCPNKHLGGNM